MPQPNLSQDRRPLRKRQLADIRRGIRKDLRIVFGKDFASSQGGRAVARRAGFLARQQLFQQEWAVKLACICALLTTLTLYLAFIRTALGIDFQAGDLLLADGGWWFVAGVAIYLLAAIVPFVAIVITFRFLMEVNRRFPVGGALLFTPLLVMAGLSLPKLLNRFSHLSLPHNLMLNACVEGLFGSSVYLLAFGSICFVASPLFPLGTQFAIASNPALHFQHYLVRATSILLRLRSLPHPNLKNADGGEDSVTGCILNAVRALRAFRGRYLNLILGKQDLYSELLEKRALALQEISMWALLPKSDTKFQLESKLRDYIRLAADGDWDALPVVGEIIDSPAYLKRTLNIARTLVLAGLPPATVFLLKRFNMLPGNQIELYITSGAWLWALAHLLSLLDPRFGKKFSAFKDLSSLPFFPKTKD